MSSRGDITRSKLLEVATRLFSASGFDSVSTRDIAASAGTTLPSIAHHFGSKEGLYRAVISSIADETAKRLVPASAAVCEKLENGTPSREDALDMLQSLLSAHLIAILDSPLDWGALIVREQLRGTDALAPLDNLLERHLFLPVAQLVSVLTQQAHDSAPVRLQALALVGRGISFRIAKPSVLRFLGWQQLTRVEIDLIVDTFRQEVRAIFARIQG